MKKVIPIQIAGFVMELADQDYRQYVRAIDVDRSAVEFTEDINEAMISSVGFWMLQKHFIEHSAGGDSFGHVVSVGVAA